MTRLSITRIANASVLIEMDGEAVLTDPLFDVPWYMRLREPIGLTPSELPRLAAIIGGHWAPDHWRPQSLSDYPYKSDTAVFVATPAMAERARRAGFGRTEVLAWGATRPVSRNLGLETAPAQRVFGRNSNSYVLATAAGFRVFVGVEANALEPLRAYRRHHPAVDVALLPIDGSTFMGRRLVLDAAGAIGACRVLGARTLIPIHYGLRPLPLLLSTPSGAAELERISAGLNDPEVIVLETGRRWSR